METCKFNSTGMKVTCNSSIKWEQSFQTAISLVKAMMADESYSVLLRIWSFILENYRNNFLELLIQNLNQQVTNQFPGNQEIVDLLEKLLELLDRNIEQWTNITNVNQSSINTNLPMEILPSILEALGLTSLQKIWKDNGNNVTVIFFEVLKEVANNSLWTDLGIDTFLPKNGTNQLIRELEILIENWISKNSDLRWLSVDVSKTLIKFTSILNGSHFTQLRQTLQNLTSLDYSSSSALKIMLNTLEVFNQVTNLNTTPDSGTLTEAYLKQLYNYIISDQNLELTLWLLDTYINHNSSFSHLLSYDFKSVAFEVLQFLYPSTLQKITSGNNTLFYLAEVLSAFMPQKDKDAFSKIINSSLQLTESVTECKIDVQDCTGSIVRVLQLLPQVIQSLKEVNNESLALLLDLSAHLNKSQLIPAVQQSIQFSLLYRAPNASENSTLSVSRVHEIVGYTLDLARNLTSSNDLNVTMLQSLLDSLKVNVTEVNEALLILQHSNFTELVHQIENLIDAVECYKQLGTDPLVCSLRFAVQSADLLQTEVLNEQIKEKIILVKLMAKYWLEQLSQDCCVMQQLSTLHSFTKWLLQNESSVNTVANYISAIQHNFKEIKSILNQKNISAYELDETVEKLQKTIQFFSDGVIKYNFTVNFNKALEFNEQQLETLKTQLQIVNQFFIYFKNITGSVNSSEIVYPIFRITQLTVAKAISDMQLSTFLSVMNSTEQLISSFSNPFSIADLLNTIHFLIKTIPQLSMFPNQVQVTLSFLQMLFPNSTSDFIPEHFLLSEESEKLTELANEFLQQYIGANISTTLSLMEKAMKMLDDFGKGSTFNAMNLLHLLENYENKTQLNLHGIAEEGTKILYDLESGGSLRKEIIYEIYNFTNHFLQREFNATASWKNYTLEKQLLDLIYIASKSPSGSILNEEPGVINCSALYFLQAVLQESMHNFTLSETIVKSDCALSLNTFLFNNGTTQNHSANQFMQLTLEAFQIYRDIINVLQNQSSKLDNSVSCLFNSIEVSAQILIKLNSFLGLKNPLIHKIHSVIVAFSQKEALNDTKCVNLDSFIINSMEHILSNQSYPGNFLLSDVLNQLEILEQYCSTNETSWSKLSALINLFIAMRSSTQWNSTTHQLKQLLLMTTNQSQWTPFRNDWKILNEVLSIRWNMSKISNYVRLTNTIDNIIKIVSGDLGLQMFHTYQFLDKVLKKLNSSVTNEQNAISSLKAINNVYTFVQSLLNLNTTHSLEEGQFLPNFTVLIEDLLFLNQSMFNTGEEGKVISQVLMYITSIITTQEGTHINSTSQVLSIIRDALLNPTNSTPSTITENISVSLLALLNVLGGTVWKDDLTKTAFYELLDTLPSVSRAVIAVSQGNFVEFRSMIVSVINKLHTFIKPISSNSAVNFFNYLFESMKIFLKKIQIGASPDTLMKELMNAFLNFIKEYYTNYLSGVLNQYINQLQTNIPGNSKFKDHLEMLLQLLDTNMKQWASTTDFNQSSINTNPPMEILKTVLESLSSTTSQEISKDNGSSATVILLSALKAMTYNNFWTDLPINKVLPGNRTSQLIKEIEILIEQMISDTGVTQLSFHVSETLIKVAFALNESEFTHVKQTLQNLINSDYNTSSIASLVISMLEVFNQVTTLDKTLDPISLAEPYLKDFYSYIISDKKLQNTLLKLSTYFNFSNHFSLLFPYDFKNISLEMLPFLHPSTLQNICSTNSSFCLLELLPAFMPEKEKIACNKIVNSSLQLIEKVNVCNNDLQNCTGDILNILQLLPQVIQSFKEVNNDSLALLLNLTVHLNNSQLMILALHELIQFSLLNWPMNENSSFSAPKVYEAVIYTLDLIINVTNANILTVSELHAVLNSLKLNVTKLNDVLFIFEHSNITKLVHQIENISSTMECYQQSGTDPLICTLRLAVHSMNLLITKTLNEQIKERILLVKSIAKYWLEELSQDCCVMQQLNALYNFTQWMLQNDSLATVIADHVSTIQYNLRETESMLHQKNFLSYEFNEKVKKIQEIIRFLTDEITSYNLSMSFKASEFSEQLNILKYQLHMVKMYIDYLKNMKNSTNILETVHPMYRITQFILAKEISDMQLSSTILTLISSTEELIRSFNNPFSMSDLLNAISFLFKTIPQQNILFNQMQSTLSLLQMMFQNSTFSPIPAHFFLHEESEKLKAFANEFLQQYIGTNISTALTLMEEVLKMLDDFGKDATFNILNLFHVLAKSETQTKLDLHGILKDGTKILYEIELNGTMSKETFNEIYNFTNHFLLNEVNVIAPWRNFTLEKQLLDLVYLASMSFSSPIPYEGQGPVNCSALHFFQGLLQALLHHTTISEVMAKVDCAFNSSIFFFSNVNSPIQSTDTFQQVASEAFQISRDILSASQNQSSKVYNTVSCLINLFKHSTGFMIKLKYFLGLRNPWIQEIHSAIVSASQEQPLNVTSCANFRNITHIIETILSNQSYPFSLLLSEIQKPIKIFAQFLSSHQVSWSDISCLINELIQLRNSSHWNSTIHELMHFLLMASNQSNWSNFDTDWQIINNIVHMRWDISDLKHYANLIQKVESLLETVNSDPGLQMVHTYQFLDNLLRQLSSSAVKGNDAISSLKAAENVYNIMKKLLNTTYLWEEDDMLQSYLTSVIQDILFLNQSVFNTVEETKVIEQIIRYITPLITMQEGTYFNSTSQMFSIIREILLNASDPASVNISETISESFLALLNVLGGAIDGNGLSDTTLLFDLLDILPAAFKAYMEVDQHDFAEDRNMTVSLISQFQTFIKAIGSSSTANMFMHLSEGIKIYVENIQQGASPETLTLQILKMQFEILDLLPVNSSVKLSMSLLEGIIENLKNQIQGNVSIMLDCNSTINWEMLSKNVVTMIEETVKDPDFIERLLQTTKEFILHKYNISLNINFHQLHLEKYLKSMNDVETKVNKIKDLLNITLHLLMSSTSSGQPTTWQETLRDLLFISLREEYSTLLSQPWQGTSCNLTSVQHFLELFKSILEELRNTYSLNDQHVIHQVINATEAIIEQVVKLSKWWKFTDQDRSQAVAELLQKLVDLLMKSQQETVQFPFLSYNFSPLMDNIINLLNKVNQFDSSDKPLDFVAVYIKLLKNYIETDLVFSTYLPLILSPTFSESLFHISENVTIKMVPILYQTVVNSLNSTSNNSKVDMKELLESFVSLLSQSESAKLGKLGMELLQLLEPLEAINSCNNNLVNCTAFVSEINQALLRIFQNLNVNGSTSAYNWTQEFWQLLQVFSDPNISHEEYFNITYKVIESVWPLLSSSQSTKVQITVILNVLTTLRDFIDHPNLSHFDLHSSLMNATTKELNIPSDVVNIISFIQQTEYLLKGSQCSGSNATSILTCILQSTQRVTEFLQMFNASADLQNIISVARLITESWMKAVTNETDVNEGLGAIYNFTMWLFQNQAFQNLVNSYVGSSVVSLQTVELALWEWNNTSPLIEVIIKDLKEVIQLLKNNTREGTANIDWSGVLIFFSNHLQSFEETIKLLQVQTQLLKSITTQVSNSQSKNPLITTTKLSLASTLFNRNVTSYVVSLTVSALQLMTSLELPQDLSNVSQLIQAVLKNIGSFSELLPKEFQDSLSLLQKLSEQLVNASVSPNSNIIEDVQRMLKLIELFGSGNSSTSTVHQAIQELNYLFQSSSLSDQLSFLSLLLNYETHDLMSVLITLREGIMLLQEFTATEYLNEYMLHWIYNFSSLLLKQNLNVSQIWPNLTLETQLMKHIPIFFQAVNESNWPEIVLQSCSVLDILQVMLFGEKKLPLFLCNGTCHGLADLCTEMINMYNGITLLILQSNNLTPSQMLSEVLDTTRQSTEFLTTLTNLLSLKSPLIDTLHHTFMFLSKVLKSGDAQVTDYAENLQLIIDAVFVNHSSNLKSLTFSILNKIVTYVKNLPETLQLQTSPSFGDLLAAFHNFSNDKIVKELVSAVVQDIIGDIIQNYTIETVMHFLYQFTDPSKWEVYSLLQSWILQSDVNNVTVENVKVLIETIKQITDLIINWHLQQNNVTQHLEKLLQGNNSLALKELIYKVLYNTTTSGNESTIDVLFQIVTSMNIILQQNLNSFREMEIYQDMIDIIEKLWKYTSSNQSHFNATETLRVLDQILIHLGPLVLEEQRMFLNGTIRFIKTVVTLFLDSRYPDNFFNITKGILESFLELSLHNISVSNEIWLQDIFKAVLLNSKAIAKEQRGLLFLNQTQFNLTHQFIILYQLAKGVAPLLPVEQRVYLNTTVQVLKSLVALVHDAYYSDNLVSATKRFTESLMEISSIIKSLVNSTGIIADSVVFSKSMLDAVLSNETNIVNILNSTVTVARGLQKLLKILNPNSTIHQILEELVVFTDILGNLSRVNSSDWAGIPIQENLSIFSDAAEIFQKLYTGNDSGNNTLSLELLTLKASQLSNLTKLLCTIESFVSVQQIYQQFGINPGMVCYPGLQTVQTLLSMLQDSVTMGQELGSNILSLPQMLRDMLLKDTSQMDWSISVPAGVMPTLDPMLINITGGGGNSSVPDVRLKSLFRNSDQMKKQLLNMTGISLSALEGIMTQEISNNFQIISQILKLQLCFTSSFNTSQPEGMILQELCNQSFEQWFNMIFTFLQYLDIPSFLYRGECAFSSVESEAPELWESPAVVLGTCTVLDTCSGQHITRKMVLPADFQTILDNLLKNMGEILTNLKQLIAAIEQLLSFIERLESLQLTEEPQFRAVVRGTQTSMTTTVTLDTLSKVLCYNGILSIFAIPQLSISSGTEFSNNNLTVQEQIEKYHIPQNSTPFCLAFYLDLVSTPEGIVMWSFLKPILRGKILYTPVTPETEAIMQKSNATLQEMDNLRQIAKDWVTNSKSVMSAIEELKQTLPVLKNSLANPFVQNFISTQTDIDTEELLDTLHTFVITGVIFKMPPKSNRRRRADPGKLSLPKLVKYTIRMDIQLSMRTDSIRKTVWVPGPHNSAIKDQTYSRGFIYLQEDIERAIIELQTGKIVEEPAVQLQSMPYPCYVKDDFLHSVTYSFPLLLMIAWVLFVAAFVKKLVEEKELRLHEYMKMMGVSPCSHFCAWFIESAIFLLITVIIIIIVLKAGMILPNSNWFILLLYLIDYSFSILAMSYLISVFFHHTNIAGLSGSLIYIIAFFPFIVMMSLETELSFSAKSLLSLFSPTAFSYASQYIARFEDQGIGIQWHNMYLSPGSHDTASFGWLCWLMVIDSVMYFTVGWYIRSVFPGKYGIAAPWYFLFLPSYWLKCCGCARSPGKRKRGFLFTNIMSQQESGHSKTKGVTTKEGGESMLTGLFSYSSGSIFVDGKDIQTDLDSIRKSMGVCMQYDVLFGYLTIEEHLLLYGHMKAPHWSKQKLQQEMENTLKETGLYAHRHKRVDALSGGMRRKLSLCIAFIGGSKTVILDEPTTGVDPCSRRSIWDIIIRNKKERTIVLSTHHLDEAEVLSDRIAFLERGGLKCSGSPFYLKETFKQGYNLTLTKKYQSTGSSKQYDVSAVTSFIRSHIPTAQLKEDNGGELVYLLPPFTTELSPAYLSLLRALDVSLNDLQLGCYGISDTTLEEVFLRLTKDTNEDNDRMWSRTRMAIPIPNLDDRVQNDEASVSSDSLSDQDEKVLTGSKKLSGLRLFLKKVMAVGIKRFHHSRRDWKGMAAQVILPVLFVIAAMGLATIRPTVNVYPEKELSPSLYGFEGQAVVFGTQNSTTDPLVSVMLNNPGIDNKCLQDPSSRHCLKEDALGQWESSENPPSEFKYCSCSEGKQACPANEFSLPHKKSYSSQVIYNATGYNMENYLLSTTHEFLRKRYGAWSFSMPLTKDLKVDLNEVPSNKTLTKVWFNPEGYHSIPVYLNTLNNFILRANLPPTNDSHQYGISLSSHPYVGPQQEVDSIVKSLVDTLVALCILMGYSIMTASFVIYVVKEHQTGAKQLQHISGISVTFYWIINFFYDMLLYLVPVALSIAVIEGFHLPSFTNRENLGAVSLLFILFGYSSLAWMYLLAGIFKDSEMAFISYVCINLFIGINTIISSSVIYFLTWFNTENQNLAHIYHVLKHVFLIFPQFCFGNGLMELSRQQAEVDLFKLYGVETYISPFQMDKVGWMFVAMAIQGTVFFTLRLLMNNWLYKKFRLLLRQITHQRSQVQVTPVHEDEDVKAEREHIEAGGSDTDLLQLDHLTKIYQHRQKKATAVNNICVGIPAGECFGLLGVNGAGKTTTFNMLTNEISPSTGKARIRNQDGILVDIADTCESGSLLGYCPQHDALDNLLTGEEHLYYYARIRGIPEKQVKVAVNHLIHRLDLTLHAAKPIFMYSCGTKRKLSTALALIGKPQILLLDEPSSGMDPKSKRQLWKTISEEVRDKCSVVLTSHSMEECEALCTRLAIMVKGQFRCIGSLQHIKNRFGSGFSVKMHLSDSMIDVSTVTEFMQSHFPRAYLKDKHLHVLEYHLSVAAGGVADIFDLLESNKVALPIKHFSVSQTTLDEVFINFAKDHADLEELDTSASEHISGVNK
nr:PREDICTED: uncharacterized protein LOC102366091 [Latimeria chalumnae]|eukprot:XP_014344924.1 PREDICTED: uncharacterized protein LOC102366091 [Latimeria chalumnae]